MRPDMERLDVVELIARRGQWASGTVGTVVETFQSSAVVEIADGQGRSQDFLNVP